MQTPYAYPEPSRPSRRPRRSRALDRRPKSAPQRTQRGVMLELGAKLIVNGVLSFAAGTSLMRLIPYSQGHTQELQEIRTVVASAEAQTSRLKADFSRYFDPRQASSIMKEQTGRESPTQRQIVWINPTKPQP